MEGAQASGSWICRPTMPRNPRPPSSKRKKRKLLVGKRRTDQRSLGLSRGNATSGPGVNADNRVDEPAAAAALAPVDRLTAAPSADMRELTAPASDRTEVKGTAMFSNDGHDGSAQTRVKIDARSRSAPRLCEASNRKGGRDWALFSPFVPDDAFRAELEQFQLGLEASLPSEGRTVVEFQ